MNALEGDKQCIIQDENIYEFEEMLVDRTCFLPAVGRKKTQ